MIEDCALPKEALLSRYANSDNYTDCLVFDLSQTVTFERYVIAFYSSRAFRPERLVLAWLLGMPSTADDIAALARGSASQFAAWTVEGRAERQILLCDYQRRTRSWLMVSQLHDGATRLWFGSAVVHSGQIGVRRRIGAVLFTLLLPVHRLYARLLLRSAARLIEKGPAD